MASRPVEEKIVKLSVDNANFKRALSESAQAFSNFGSSLGNVRTEGLKGVEASAKGVGASLKNLVSNIPIIGGIASKIMDIGSSFFKTKGSVDEFGGAVDGLGKKFSILNTAAGVALGNIATKALGAVANGLKKLTIDPIIDGYNEYGTKMKSITTIMTNSGKSVGEVNKVLQDLNTYSDKTIYSFSDMTQAIGTMAAAGVDINTASTSIQGFYNLAAGTGIEAARAGGLLDTAMNQAISLGKMDYANWKQLQSAGMGGPKFQNALVENAKAMGKNVDLSNGFNDSLKDGWATTDVLLATLKQFATDKSLLEAATQVKTFGELVGTVQESVGSGWATTWELVFGNADQAKVLWTGINNIIGPIINNMSNSRNSMLQLWQSMGGRDKMVQAITNAFSSLGKIINAIGGAFNEVFPKSAENQARGLTNIMTKLADVFKINDAAVNGIKQIFIVFFNILKGGFTIIGAFAKVIEFLIPDHLVQDIVIVIGMLAQFGNTVVKLGSILVKGLNLDWLTDMFKGTGKETQSFSDKFTNALSSAATNLDKFTKDTVAKFQAFINGLVKTSGQAGNAISGGFKSVSDFFGKLKTVVSDTISSMQKGQDFLSAFGDAMDNVFGNSVVTKLSQFVDGLNGSADAVIKMGRGVPTLTAFGAAIRQGIGDAIKTVSTYLQKFIDWSNQVGSQVPGALRAVIDVFAKAASKLNEFITGTKVFADTVGDNMAKGTDKMTSIVDIVADKWTRFRTAMDPILRPIGNLFAAIAKAVADLMNEMNTSSILKTGLVVGLFKFYKSMDGKKSIIDRIKEALSGFFGIFEKIGSWGDAKNVLDQVQKSLKTWQNTLRAKALKDLAVSIGIIAASIAALSFIEPSKLGMAVAAIAMAAGVLMGAFAIFSKINVKSLDTAKIIVAANGMSIAMGFMALAVKHLDGMDPTSALVAVGSLATLTTVLGGVMIAMSKWGGDAPVSAGAMLVVAGAVNVMAMAVKKIGDMNPASVAIGLGAMVTIMGSMVVMIKAMQGGDKVTTASAFTVGAIAVSMGKMAGAIQKLGSMDWQTLLQGMGALSALMGGVIIVSKSLSNVKGAAGAAVMLSMAAAMNALIIPIAALGAMPIPMLIQGLIGLGVALAELVAAAALASGTVAGAAAIGILAASVNLLIVPIAAIGALPISVIATGITAMGVALGVLIAAGFGAEAVAIGLGVLSASILSISTAVGITAVALPLLATGLAALVATVAVSGKGIIAAIKTILDGIGTLGGSIGNAVFGVVSGIATGLARSVGSIVDAASTIIQALAGALVDNAYTIGDAVIKVLEALLQAFTNNLPGIVTTIGTLIIVAINTLSSFIVNNQQAILNAVANIMTAVMTVISMGLQTLLMSIPVVGPKMADALKGATGTATQAIKDAFPAQTKIIGADAGVKLADGFGGEAGKTGDAAKKHKDSAKGGLSGIDTSLGALGGAAGSAFAGNLGGKAGAAGGAAGKVKGSTQGGLSGIDGQLGNLGGAAGGAFANNLNNKSGNARNAGNSIKGAAQNGASGGNFHGIGAGLGQTYADGLGSKTGSARSAGSSNGQAAKEGAESVDLHGSGQSLMDGFASGIGSMVNSVKGAAANVLKQVGNLFPHSPAKEGPFSGKGYTTFSGAALMQGFAEGMESAQDETAGRAQGVMKVVASTIEMIQNGIDTSMELNPVITPVMDLSNISDVDINGNYNNVAGLQRSLNYIPPTPGAAVSIGNVSIPISVPDGQAAEDTMDVFRDKFHQVMDEEIRKAI